MWVSIGKLLILPKARKKEWCVVSKDSLSDQDRAKVVYQQSLYLTLKHRLQSYITMKFYIELFWILNTFYVHKNENATREMIGILL